MTLHTTPAAAAGNSSGWVRVSREHPCPVCGRDHNCSTTTDGVWAYCGRIAVGSIRTNDGGQYLHRLTEGDALGDDTPAEHAEWLERQREQASQPEPDQDWSALADRYFGAPDAEQQRRILADELGVSPEALNAMSVGWTGDAWSIPERDGTGSIIGLSLRAPDGSKRMVAGSKRGLTYSPDWQDDAGPVILVEGASDTAAGMTLGFCTIGRPSNVGGVNHLAELLKDVPADRPVLILGELDAKPDCSWPGKDGAERTATGLAGILNRPVDWSIVPGGAKDLRNWLAQNPFNNSDWRDSSSEDSFGSFGNKSLRTEFISRLHVHTIDPEPWPDIVSIEVPPVPEFPVHVLPVDLSQWVFAESHATQTPPELAAIVSLAVCSASVAKRVKIEAWDGWQEPLNIFGAVVLPPGNRKSTVFRDATAPLRELEQELIESRREEVSDAISIRRQREGRLKKLENKAAGGDLDASREACRIEQELSSQPPPAYPRLIVSDATSEALCRELMLQGGRLASLSPEGDVFALMGGKYSKGSTADLDVYLKAHAGDDLESLRIGRTTVTVREPCLVCCYTVQPSVLDDLQESSAFRGRGLLARFAWVMPDSPVGSREIKPEPVHPDLRMRYRELIRNLHSIQGESVLRLSPDAEGLFYRWNEQIESELSPEGRLHPLADWGGKLTGLALRIAGILHCCSSSPDVPVSPEIIGAATAIGDFLIPHAERVLIGSGNTTDRTVPDAVWVLNWIRRHQHREFNLRDVRRSGRRFETVEDIEPAVALLSSRGYLREAKQDGKNTGRKPTPLFIVNPAVLNSEP